MIKYNGRLLWKQYMPKKPTKWGIQLWFLCDSISGYCLTSCVHRTRHQHMYRPDMWIWVSIYSRDGADAALHLMRHHHLYADNFFSSLPLVEDLYAADTYYCGTLRKDRVGIPRQLQNVPLQKYESVKWQQDHSQIIVTNWKDKRNVYVIATHNDGADVMRARTKFCQEEMITDTVVQDVKYGFCVWHYHWRVLYHNVRLMTSLYMYVRGALYKLHLPMTHGYKWYMIL